MKVDLQDVLKLIDKEIGACAGYGSGFQIGALKELKLRLLELVAGCSATQEDK